jgi:hypothetical protein
MKAFGFWSRWLTTPARALKKGSIHGSAFLSLLLAVHHRPLILGSLVDSQKRFHYMMSMTCGDWPLAPHHTIMPLKSKNKETASYAPGFALLIQVKVRRRFFQLRFGQGMFGLD